MNQRRSGCLDSEIAAALVRAGHRPADVKLFLVLLAYDTYRRAQSDESPDEFIQRVLRTASRTADLPGPPNSVAELAARYAELFPHRPDWREVPGDWFAPTCADTLLNRLARQMSQLRDRHMVNVLADTARRGERVFAVVGGSHVVMQEAALRARLPSLNPRPPDPH